MPKIEYSYFFQLSFPNFLPSFQKTFKEYGNYRPKHVLKTTHFSPMGSDKSKYFLFIIYTSETPCQIL